MEGKGRGKGERKKDKEKEMDLGGRRKDYLGRGSKRGNERGEGSCGEKEKA